MHRENKLHVHRAEAGHKPWRCEAVLLASKPPCPPRARLICKIIHIIVTT